ncbi:DJ-1/PfpI/YhbO family deglycase/protease [candidate division KSB3 bacterium]|uniref:DJ-1/PfpI/YhbO family deglycase/protease n=1 Tax=candidate division KSB3 bacterium TaxID=2044937 RepID=A0A9D5Q5L0_9BACT|nr:DJ-1/PfpI/YhbO family deglycase/protease [candidate division KSB3 bacterium]MBD3323986.1 DJ-1/PfpI/YhbO family deglycase/protease [candidate division KSB3 bacterium]
MSLAGKKIAIFLEELFEDLEFWYPYYRMQEAGAEVIAVAPKIATYTGKHGLPAKADQTIYEVKVTDVDALIIPGGYSPDYMRRTPEMVTFVKDVHQAGKVVAAICHGGWMLASAGIIQGTRLTSFFAIKDDLVNAGADWIDQDVVSEKNIVTSRTPRDLPVFCKAIIAALS